MARESVIPDTGENTQQYELGFRYKLERMFTELFTSHDALEFYAKGRVTLDAGGEAVLAVVAPLSLADFNVQLSPVVVDLSPVPAGRLVAQLEGDNLTVLSSSGATDAGVLVDFLILNA